MHFPVYGVPAEMTLIGLSFLVNFGSFIYHACKGSKDNGQVYPDQNLILDK